MMMKMLPVIIVIGLFLYVFSLVQVDLFFWKDGQKFERVVVTTKTKEYRTDYAPFPEDLQKDDRLEHREGISGLGTYGFERIKECIPQSEEENADGNQNTAQNRIPPRTHSVGKAPTEEGSAESDASSAETAVLPLTPPVLNNEPEVLSTQVSSAVGNNAGAGVEDFSPDKGMQIPRVYESPDDILVASFDVDPWYPRHMGISELVNDMVVVLAQYDLTAVQGMYMENTDMLRTLTQELKRRSGRPYKFAVVLPQEKSQNAPVPVFFYDSNVMEMDASTLRLVGKPGAPFGFPPLAAKFRVKKAEAEKAFTFIAVNYNAYEGCEVQEAQYIPNVINALKDANSKGVFNKEDDVVIFGHFGVNPNSLVIGDANYNASLVWGSPEMPTNTFGTFSFVAENILFQAEPLSEFTGASGVWDLRRQYHRAKGIPFDQHPVWARFGIYEGKAN